MTEPTDTDQLPPTQYLVLEVLAARYRTGESLWPFPSRVRPALVELERAGLIETMHGNVPATLRASLTEAGRAAVLSDTYVPPGADHDYLSTGCLHGDHGYCASMTGLVGAKRPASCKFCGAQCRCPCHTEAAANGPTHYIADGSGLTVCCGRTPFELPRSDRITSVPGKATCEGFQLPITPPVPSFDQEGTP